MVKKLIIWISLFLINSLIMSTSFASIASDGLGQTIQIYTQFKKITGNPTWLLIVRDIDNNQNIPYLYDIKKGDNFWLAFTFGRNYVITVSSMAFNSPNKKKISNFCGLESNGRIIRGESLYITINGHLSPNRNTVNCNVLKFADSNFTIVEQKNSAP